MEKDTSTLSAERLLRVAAVAAILDLPERRVYQLARAGVLPHVRVGRSIRFDKSKIEEWIEAGGAAYPEDTPRAAPRVPRVTAADSAERRAQRLRDRLDEMGAWRDELHKLNSREAAVLAARLQGDTLREVGDHFAMTHERVRQVQDKARRKLMYYVHLSNRARAAEALPTAEEEAAPDVAERGVSVRLDQPVESLNLSTRTVHSLQEEGIDTIEALVGKERGEVKKVGGIGAAAMRDIEAALESRGLGFAPD